MYTTSFYSFKGGVGRSLALVNVGFELAKRNHCILFVDFDLAAPALDTFNSLAPRKSRLGMVEFINAYLNTGQVDEIDKYVHKCNTEFAGDGALWLMPAGSSKSSYVNSFLDIDWEELYANQNGFLLMEELKHQWMEKIQPDYVFVDSPVGYSDVGSICTRHIPDAVVIFYVPNAEHLRGLSRVVKGIRVEKESARQKEIQLHFVMSNVPDLDDELPVLNKEIEKFKVQLELHKSPMVIHHYHSLSLLNHAVFTHSQPESRLAAEYRQIVDCIVNGQGSPT